MKFLYCSATLALLAIGFVGCAKKEASADTPESLATVNSDPISKKEYFDYLERKQTIFVTNQSGEVQSVRTAGNLGVQALRDLVERRLLFQMAKDAGVLPTADDVQKELDFRNSQRKGYEDSMINVAMMTKEMLLDQLKFELAKERLVTKGVTVTPAEVEQYVKENQKQFTEPPMAKLRLLIIQDASKKSAVEKDIAAGVPFTSVITKYAEDPKLKQAGGVYPETNVSRMSPDLQKLIAKTAKGKTSDWISLGKAYVKVYVEDKAPAKPIVLTPEIKNALRRQLAVQRGQLTNNIDQQLQDKLKVANISVTPPELSKPFDALLTQFKQQSAAQETSPPGGAPKGGPGGGSPTPSGPGAKK